MATRALLEADLQLAEQVIADDVRHRRAARSRPRRRRSACCAPGAGGHGPAGGDLRDPRRRRHRADGRPALHVAQAARRRHPQLVLPDEVAPYFAEMGKIAVALAQKAAEVIRSRDVEIAGTLEADDDAMDDLHRHLFSVLMAPSWAHGVGPAVDITLLGRFYERYADHAVTVARRVVYVVTGRMPGSLPV